MADCNMQETCSLMIFLSLRRIANAITRRTALPLPRTPFSAKGVINHVNVFMNNKLIRFRTSCMYICADACNPGSTQFNPLSTEPGSTRVVMRTRLKVKQITSLDLAVDLSWRLHLEYVCYTPVEILEVFFNEVKSL